MMAGLGAFVSRDIAYPKYELHSSVILDSGATLHIGNDKARFLGLTLANRDEFLYAREDHILIVAYGTIELTIQTRGYLERRKIKLTKAAYILTFYTSIVSLQLLNKHQVYWNNRTTSLEFGTNKLHFADTPITYSQWVLEYNTLPKSVFQALIYIIQDPTNQDPTTQAATFKAHLSRHPRPIKQASLDDWHKMMGHLYPEALLKIKQ